ncbi:MAG: ABC transporter permease [Clostridiales bacterium GWC2_40_7]|nr:MAG: ABC transporter permease [Clostridiales bacterium GWC2_40_7]
MAAIFWKEVKSYFYSPIAYVLIGLFIVLTSIFFTFGNLLSMSGNFNGVLGNAIVFLVFIIPILTMKIMAEDRKNGTEVLLLTSPASLTSIVVGKFLASYFVYVVLTVITFIYPIVLLAFGGQFTPSMVGGYIGFLLLGAAFISVGIFASALTESQVIAAVIGVVSLFVMYIAGSISTSIGGVVGKILDWFSLLNRYDDFSNGILGLTPVVYYLSFVGVFLFLTVRIIEKRRWSQG